MRTALSPTGVARPLILLLIVGQFAWAYQAAGRESGRELDPGILPEEKSAGEAASLIAMQLSATGPRQLQAEPQFFESESAVEEALSFSSQSAQSGGQYWPAAPTPIPVSRAVQGEAQVETQSGSREVASKDRKDSQRAEVEGALRNTPLLDVSQEGVLDASPIRRLVIPALELDAEVVEAPFVERTWDISELGGKIAWLSGTAWPSMEGNTALAGHITARGIGEGPFRYLHRLRPGDFVSVITEKYEYVYRVREQVVVNIEDVHILAPTSSPQLTLLTCTNWDKKLLQYRNRRAVFADLVRVVRLD